jgi:carbamate kinase
MIVICAGGGVPVIRRSGRLTGVEAVIDKDLAAALLARSLGADALLLLTDVPGVLRDPRAEHPEVLRTASTGHLHALRLPAGSMAPKAEAAVRFAAGGGLAAIGALDDARAVLAGTAGTAGTQVMAPARYAPTPGWPR